MNTISAPGIEPEAKRRGPPIGPRLSPQEVTDEHGTYLTFPGRNCGVCGVGLTSRNRYFTSVLCGPHGRAMERQRIRKPKVTRGALSRPAVPSGATPAIPAAAPESCPQRLYLLGLFSSWLRYPTSEIHFRMLRQGMNDYELGVRVKQAIPGGPDPQTPLTNQGN